MDLSKAYDCVPHDFQIAKLKKYSLGKTSLHLLRDYLSIENKGQKQVQASETGGK